MHANQQATFVHRLLCAITHAKDPSNQESSEQRLGGATTTSALVCGMVQTQCAHLAWQQGRATDAKEYYTSAHAHLKRLLRYTTPSSSSTPQRRRQETGFERYLYTTYFGLGQCALASAAASPTASAKAAEVAVAVPWFRRVLEVYPTHLRTHRILAAVMAARYMEINEKAGASKNAKETEKAAFEHYRVLWTVGLLSLCRVTHVSFSSACVF